MERHHKKDCNIATRLAPHPSLTFATHLNIIEE